MEKEIWKDIPEYDGRYQVSSLGRVKSLLFNKERILKHGVNTHGYYMVVLSSKTKKPLPITIHQLVAMAFLNHKRDGNKYVVDHINNIKTDNTLSNLQIISQRLNLSKDKSNFTDKSTGIYWSENRKKWESKIVNKGKKYFLGRFKDKQDAINAYQEKLKELTSK